MEGNTQPYPNI